MITNLQDKLSMIILEELTFKFVEAIGFKKLIRMICLLLNFLSRTTITRDVMYRCYESIQYRSFIIK